MVHPLESASMMEAGMEKSQSAVPIEVSYTTLFPFLSS